MPKLWNETIEGHRNAVARAIMDTAATLALSEGLHALTMARIAQEAGIGRATLYKYFGDVEEILAAWHEHQIAVHLSALEEARLGAPTPLAALEAALVTYGGLQHRPHDHALAALLHNLPHVQRAHARLQNLVAGLVDAAVKSGEISSSASPAENARYAIAAMAAVEHAGNRAALHRLVSTILRGMGTRT
jgi:AcrR family transcriptional regulator